MQQRPVDVIAVKQRRDVDAVLDLKLAVAFLGVELPVDLAAEIAADELAGAEEGIDVLAVGAGTGGGEVGLVLHEALLAQAHGQARLPQLLAIPVQTQEGHVVAVLTGHEDLVLPDGRRRAAHARHFRGPDNVRLGRELRGQVLFGTEPVQIGPTPLRPIVGPNRPGQGEQQQCGVDSVTHYGSLSAFRM